MAWPKEKIKTSFLGEWESEWTRVSRTLTFTLSNLIEEGLVDSCELPGHLWSSIPEDLQPVVQSRGRNLDKACLRTHGRIKWCSFCIKSLMNTLNPFPQNICMPVNRHANWGCLWILWYLSVDPGNSFLWFWRAHCLPWGGTASVLWRQVMNWARKFYSMFELCKILTHLSCPFMAFKGTWQKMLFYVWTGTFLSYRSPKGSTWCSLSSLVPSML